MIYIMYEVEVLEVLNLYYWLILFLYNFFGELKINEVRGLC